VQEQTSSPDFASAQSGLRLLIIRILAASEWRSFRSMRIYVFIVIAGHILGLASQPAIAEEHIWPP